MTEVEIYKKPIEILSELSEKGSLMSNEQLAYLCGLIKMNKPKKIVEVGVAAGGTTAVVLNCIDKLGLDCEMHSVEISSVVVGDGEKKSGYLAEECKTMLENPIKHKLHIGVLPDCIDEIGGEIDFLILDTTHLLPGELLDFLVALPYLTENAIVVLHDIWVHHWEYSVNENSQATRVLLSAAVGEKLVCSSLPSDLNIGAIMLNADTRKYVENIFHALALTWKYIPGAEYLDLCRRCYARHYEERLVALYDLAVEKNIATKKRVDKIYCDGLSDISGFITAIRGEENIYIFGAGLYGKLVYSFLKNAGISIVGFVISDGHKKEKMDLPVYYVSEVDLSNSALILAVKEKTQQVVSEMLRGRKLIRVKESILLFLRLG